MDFLLPYYTIMSRILRNSLNLFKLSKNGLSPWNLPQLTTMIIIAQLRARRAALRSTITIGSEPHACIGIYRNHACNSLFVVNMASGIDHEHVGQLDNITPVTWSTEAFSLVLQHANVQYQNCTVQFWYWTFKSYGQLTRVKTRYPLTSNKWPYKLTVSRKKPNYYC